MCWNLCIPIEIIDKIYHQCYLAIVFWSENIPYAAYIPLLDMRLIVDFQCVLTLLLLRKLPILSFPKVKCIIIVWMVQNYTIGITQLILYSPNYFYTVFIIQKSISVSPFSFSTLVIFVSSVFHTFIKKCFNFPKETDFCSHHVSLKFYSFITHST